MRTIVLLIALTCVSGALIGFDKPEYELDVVNAKIEILYRRISLKCPSYVNKRFSDQDKKISEEISVANELYQTLLEKYIQCKKESEGGPSKEPQSAQVRDCQEYYKKGERHSGVYKIQPGNSTSHEFSVWCDFDSGHGWTVLQRRDNGSVTFDRPWDDYKNGFGDVSGEHWLGNEKIFRLTKTNQILNIQLEADNDNKAPAFGTWQEFYLADESDSYKLSISKDGYSGTLPEVFSSHNGANFSTTDRDNARWAGNCAFRFKGGWWWMDCGYVGPFYTSMGWSGYSKQTSSSLMRVTRDQ